MTHRPPSRGRHRNPVRARAANWFHRHPALRQRVVKALAPALRVLVVSRYPQGAKRHPRAAIAYILGGRELDNFTYDVANLDELTPTIAGALEESEALIDAYLAECRTDAAFARTIDQQLATRPDKPNHAFFGRRYGWYVAIRTEKPRLVVETGTHDGLGSALLLRALERNTEEGHPGELISFDIEPTCGWLVEPRPKNWTLVIGDTKRTLPETLGERKVDLFIHDSLHTIAHESFEFGIARTHSADRCVLITDNAHMTSVLREVAASTGATYCQFDEQIAFDTWFSGSSLGITVLRSTSDRTLDLGA